MSVHKELTKHIEKINSRVVYFQKLDEQREKFIEEAIYQCQNGEAFSVEAINKVTKEINELAKQGAVPTRKLVTKEMVKVFVDKKNKL